LFNAISKQADDGDDGGGVMTPVSLNNLLDQVSWMHFRRYSNDIRGVMTPVFVTYSLWTKSVGYIPKRSATNIRGVMGRLLGRGIVEGGLFR